jgi:hypothetical protein
MWRGAENLGMDKVPHRLDIANGPGLDPQRMNHPLTVQALAAPQRHRAVILARLVWCRTRGGWTLSAQEYFEFLRR